MDPDERLAFLIGSIVRADVAMEGALMHVWVILVGGNAALVAPMGLTALRESVEVLVASVAMAERDRLAAAGTLKAAELAHRERNRVTHDRWMPSPVAEMGSEEFMRVRVRGPDRRVTATPVSLSDLDSVLVQVKRAHQRLLALFWIVWPYGGDRHAVRAIDPEDAENFLEIAEDKFMLTADGTARPQRWGPAPD